jgi:hypothetical protein
MLAKPSIQDAALLPGIRTRFSFVDVPGGLSASALTSLITALTTPDSISLVIPTLVMPTYHLLAQPTSFV